MFNSRWFFLAALISSSAFAGVSFEQKQMRVEALMKLEAHAPALAFEAYQRELQYEKLGLSLDARAKSETNLLADKIRQQVNSAYRAALAEYSDADVAREEVRKNIEKDMSLASPDLQVELLNLANETLESIDAGGLSAEVDLSNVQAVMKKEVENRYEFLNNEEFGNTQEPVSPVANPNKESERKEYASKAELMEALVSDRESSRWVSTSSQTIKTSEITSVDSKISLQVKFTFLGIAVEAGPVISFNRDYSTNAVILAEGLHPVLLNDGNFDYWKRDQAGNVVVKNGKNVKRYIAFFCDTDLQFSTNYTGSGGFKFLGLGGEASVSQKFVNSVNLTSRRLALPEYVANKSMTIKYISELCHYNFLGARYSNRMTVSDSLNVMMKNIVAGLEFSHPKTKCAMDSHCYSWFNNEVISLVKIKNFPRCREENSREKFRSCQLRGLEGQNCPVIEKGVRTSNGEWEYACDTGLKCVKYESRSYFMGQVWSPAKGKCQIINKKTYRSPFEKEDDGYIEVSVEL